MINPKKELFKWGPIDGRPVYPSYWFFALTNFPKRFVSWPTCYTYTHKEKFIFICDYQLLRDKGEENFRRYVLVDDELKKYYTEWQEVLKEFLIFLKKITKESLQRLDNSNILALFNEFEEI